MRFVQALTQITKPAVCVRERIADLSVSAEKQMSRIKLHMLLV